MMLVETRFCRRLGLRKRFHGLVVSTLHALTLCLCFGGSSSLGLCVCSGLFLCLRLGVGFSGGACLRIMLGLRRPRCLSGRLSLRLAVGFCLLPSLLFPAAFVG
jgi:hypothetical protein